MGKLTCRSSNGERQIIDTPVKGDVVGWGHFANATFSAITDLHLIEVPANSFEQAIKQQPGLHKLVIQAISRQNAILAEHLVNAGRRNSLKRTAHFLLEMEEDWRRPGSQGQWIRMPSDAARAGGRAWLDCNPRQSDFECPALKRIRDFQKRLCRVSRSKATP